MIPAYLGIRWFEKIFFHRTKDVDWSAADPIQTPCIFAANHPDSIDPCVIAAHLHKHLGKPAFFVATNKIEKIFGSQLTFHWLRLIIARDHTTINQALDVLKNNHCLVIFPTGKLDFEPLTLSRAKPGLGIFALKSGLPVYPIGYLGPYNHSYDIKGFFKNLFGNQPVRIKVGAPLQFIKVTGRLRKAQILDTTEQIISAINNLVAEIKD